MLRNNHHQRPMLRFVQQHGPLKSTLLTIGTILLLTVSVVVVTSLLIGVPLLPGLAVSMLINASLLPVVHRHSRLIDELQRTRAQLYQNSIHDELTGAYNRRYFFEQLNQACAQNRRKRDQLAVVLFDIDHFKEINDLYGHAAGDSVLREISRICRSHSRSNDIFARYGGEEFVFLLRDLDLTQAYEFAQRIHRQVLTGNLHYNNQPLFVTISIGIQMASDTDGQVDSLMLGVDRALYHAKRNGRNQIAVADHAELQDRTV